MMKRWWSYSTVVASSVAVPMAMADANRARMGSRARFRVSWRLVAIFLAMKFITASVGLLIFSALANSARAEMAAPAHAPAATVVAAPIDDAKVMVKSVTGKVVAMTKRNLSVEYEARATASGTEISEMLLPFGKEMALEHLTNLDELKRGDTVSVRFKQRYHDDVKGNPILLSTEILSVTLMKNDTGALQSTR